MSRSARITLLLVIDILFFFVELIVGVWGNLLCSFRCSCFPGYAVGSLALVADSFHMLKWVPGSRRQLPPDSILA